VASERFRLFWKWKVRHGKPGRPAVPKDVRDLIRTISHENLLWGLPRIHGKLLKLGIEISARREREQVPGSSLQTAVTDVANVPRQPYQQFGVGGLLHSADDALQILYVFWF
jgi:hypothetical protein